MEIYAEGTKVQGKWMGQSYTGVITFSDANGLGIKFDSPIRPQACPEKTSVNIFPDSVVKYTIEVIETPADEPQVMTFEEFAAHQGCDKTGSDYGMHSMRGLSEGQRNRLNKLNLKYIQANWIKREAARVMFQGLLERGIVREPTRTEKLIAIAQGHDDNSHVQAARRLLTRYGIEWSN